MQLSLLLCSKAVSLPHYITPFALANVNFHFPHFILAFHLQSKAFDDSLAVAVISVVFDVILDVSTPVVVVVVETIPFVAVVAAVGEAREDVLTPFSSSTITAVLLIVGSLVVVVVGGGGGGGGVAASLFAQISNGLNF